MLDKIHDFIMAHQVASGSVVIIVDLICRYLPSQKALGVVHTIAGLFHKLGDIFSGIASFIDSLLGQKIK